MWKAGREKDEISEVDELVRFDSITTMIDGLNIEKSLDTYDVAREQIKAADILLLNKKDLLNEFQLQKINRKLKEMNPTAPILLTRHGDINPALVYGVDPQDESVEVHRNEVQKKAHHKHHSHEFDGLSSYKISLADPLERGHFIEAIQSLPSSVFRIKGVVDVIGDDKPLLFQYVGGRFEFSEFNNPKMPDRFLILIRQDFREGTDLIDWSRFFCTPQHLAKLPV